MNSVGSGSVSELSPLNVSYLLMTRFIIAASLATQGFNALFGNDRRHHQSGRLNLRFLKLMYDG